MPLSELMAMQKEKVKNLILTSLVLMSVFFTVQLWLDVPIERIFSRPSTASGQGSEEDYNLSDFVLPRWIVVNFGGPSRTKLFMGSSTYKQYEDIYRETVDVVGYIFEHTEELLFTQVDAEELTQARLDKSIVLEYNDSFDIELIRDAFGVGLDGDKSPIRRIKSITLTFASQNQVLIEDEYMGVIYRTVLPVSVNGLVELVNRLEDRDPVKYWSLGRDINYGANDNLYVPLDMSSFSLSVCTAEKELDVGEHDRMEVLASKFFEDMSIVRKITETNSSLVFTDGHSALRIASTGAIEFQVYSNMGIGQTGDDFTRVMNNALNFVESHGGIPEQMFLEEVSEITKGQMKGYVLKFNYAYDGMPFVYSQDFGQKPIEVTIINGRVTNYRRLLYRITKARVENRSLINPIEAFNVIALETQYGSEENRPVIIDMYLGYYIDRLGLDTYRAVPVWFIKSESGDYVIDAYEGQLLK
jgi:regulatory protein YycH of two-component signal transduction system YycFG